MPKIFVSKRCMELIQEYAAEFGHLLDMPAASPSGEYELSISQETLDRLSPYRNIGVPLSDTLEDLLVVARRLAHTARETRH